MIFEPGDWVWLHMKKERFLTPRRSKLLPKRDEPFQVLERINNNAYKLDLPGEYNVSATFNVYNLSLFDVDDDLRTNPSQDERNDASTTNKWSVDPIQVPVGPVARARAKKFKETLNAFIQHIWAEESLWRPQRNDKSVIQDWVSVIQALE